MRPSRSTTRAVGALHHLVEAMGDEDDADAVGLETGDDSHQAVGLGQRQARGRLVHDDETRIERQCLHDLDQLALRQRQIGKRCIRREIGAKALEQRTRLRIERLAVDQPERPAMRGSRPMKTLPATSRLSKRLSSW